MDRPIRTGYCSLTIKINNVKYSVRPCSWNGSCKVYTVTKHEHDNPCYKVGVGNSYFCNCPDNMKNKPEGGCKHIKALRALWII